MRKILAILLLASLAWLPCRAEVAGQGSGGFTVKVATLIHAGPQDVYSRLVHNIGDWWDPQHTISNDAHNLSIDDKPMGCFCEKLPAGGGVRHMQVIMVMPNKMLVMSGALGPLQKFAAIGTMTIVLEPMHSDTRVQMIYAVGGYLPEGLNTWAAPVDQVLTQQMTRLKSYVETGNPVVAGAK